MSTISSICVVQKNSNCQPYPKVWVSSFPSVDGNGILVLAIMKILKNGCHLVNMHHTEIYQITNLPKIWVSSFPSVDRNAILASAIMKRSKNGHYFVNMCHTEKF